VTDSSVAESKRVRGLRANSFAAIVILLIEYGLGIWVNLYAHLPRADHGADVAGGFGRAVADGPVGLSIHALVGVILVVSATTAVVRSILIRRIALVVVAALGLVAVLVAGLGGARFVGQGTDASSMTMAIGAGVAIGAYAFILFVSPGGAVRSRS
jgi:hypothetical protein